ncbi:hypothetical protein M9458_057998 [Cirrhinus mrigala]|uniref:Gypsy retrotransposon integrase-like protein 1 n=1 Tax=Cirrhinus mrigala TaxID=683832 RepID=A0ABD0MEF1_CIRMR
MSSSDPFQELVDSVRQAILATLPTPTAPNPPPSPAFSPTINNASSPLSVVCPMVRTTPFSGAAGDCKGFLLQCSITFATYPHVFNSDSSKIGYLISCLTGTALRWAESIWNQAGPPVRSYTAFTYHFLEVFGRVDQETSAGEELYHFHQGTLSIQEYSVRFRTLAASSGWNESALLTTYRQGLEPKLQMMLAPHDDSMGLERFIQMTVRCATRISSYSHSSMSTGGASPSPPVDHSPPEQPPEPMQVDSRRLTLQERQRCLSMGLCLYCGQSNHQIRDCPTRPEHPLVSTILPMYEKLNPFTSNVILTANDVSLTVAALIDSGSAGNFISSALAQRLGLKTTPTEATHAFQQLKHSFISAPILAHPDPQRPFVVEVDASTTGVGAVLSQQQQQGKSNELHPCAYYSKKLSPAERNYDIGNRELLAIKLALEEWRHWLEGSIHPFQILTDHKNLQYLRDAKRLTPRQARWALFFTRFQFSISYRPGAKNVRANALSHIHSTEETQEPTEPILSEKIFVNPIQWMTPPVASDPAPEAPPDCPPHRRFVPPDERIPLIHSSHTSLGTGHPGTNRTLSLLQDRFWWPRMEQDVQRYVRGCRECAMSKSPRHLPSGKLVPLPVPNRPWSHLGVDFITDLPPSEGNTCILVIVDRFSKFCRLIPLQGLPTAWNTAKLLFDQVFRSYGLPEDIVSDRGRQFISRVWKAFFRLLGVTVSLSSGYHPQTNGQTERKIQEVGRFLRTFCTSHQDTWNQFLGWAEFAQNSLRQATTGLTPFQCILGFQPPLFPWTGEPSDVPSVDYWFRESERVWDEAHQHLQRAVHRQVTTADRRRSDAPTFQVGNKVWLSTRDIRLRLPCKKLSPRFVGPFTITEQINPVTYWLQLPAHYRIHPTFHVSLLKPHYDSLLPTEPGREEPPPPMITEEGTIYRVKEILNSRRRGGRLQYFVDWEAYGPEERSWVSREDILDPTLLTDFHQNHPDRPAPRNRAPRSPPDSHRSSSLWRPVSCGVWLWCSSLASSPSDHLCVQRK